MIWFKENRPEIPENAHRFLFIPSLLINRLTGALKNDATMMGTAMMADLKKRDFSSKILKAIGIRRELFGEIGEPGEKAGEITSDASAITGLPVGTPVFLSGHDTQFAIIGSGAKLNQPVLSSGTWEILMARSQAFSASSSELKRSLTTEADAEAGIYNIGQNWLGSGVLEWFSRNFYQGLSGNELYRTMIQEAEEEQPGSEGIWVDPAFYEDGSGSQVGTIKGLTIASRRGQIYRAFLEGLAYRMREGLEALEAAGNFRAESIICVGGGSKNKLWNQLRADVCNTPVQLIDQKETTALGAMMFVFIGTGLYKNIDEARAQIKYNPHIIQPSINQQVYQHYYTNFLKFKASNSK